MSTLRYTLLTDGSSDRALIPIVNWLLRKHLTNYEIQSEWADLSRLPAPPKDLSKRVESAVNLYPCDVLFIHRDAEACELDRRVQEIEAELSDITELRVPVVKVIPVRMTEAWLLFDEGAIRIAASNPNGSVGLELPNIKNTENISDPKALLHNALKQASQLSGRRLKRFNPHSCVCRISELIDDFSPLRTLPAFCALEDELQSFINIKLLDATD
jgi:hypothetical protein